MQRLYHCLSSTGIITRITSRPVFNNAISKQLRTPRRSTGNLTNKRLLYYKAESPLSSPAEDNSNILELLNRISSARVTERSRFSSALDSKISRDVFRQWGDFSGPVSTRNRKRSEEQHGQDLGHRKKKTYARTSISGPSYLGLSLQIKKTVSISLMPGNVSLLHY